jgi:hypothetical protein
MQVEHRPRFTEAGCNGAGMVWYAKCQNKKVLHIIVTCKHYVYAFLRFQVSYKRPLIESRHATHSSHCDLLYTGLVNKKKMKRQSRYSYAHLLLMISVEIKSCSSYFRYSIGFCYVVTSSDARSCLSLPQAFQ